MEWQPIETAPRDFDIPILAFNSRHKAHAPVVVRWNDDPCEPMPQEPHWADAATAGGTALYFNSLYFDYWMPLPAAPTDAAPTAAARAGWVEWKGGECPVSEDTGVEIRLRCGEENGGHARGFDWGHDIGSFGYEGDDDIIAYRVVQS